MSNEGHDLFFTDDQALALSVFNPELLVTIASDGTVKIIKEGSALEAAKMFWECISQHFQGIIAERDALKLQVEGLLETVGELEEELDGHRDWDDSDFDE